ncbi:MAG: T9SS type A sorting domain-containing protein [Candidatus Latescibacterota bacterium]
MPSRRNFLKTVALAAGGAAAAAQIESIESRYQQTGFFGLHQFIEGHPDAVFVMQTNIEKKTDSEAIRNIALEFSRSVFWPKSTGLPLTTNIPVKPNLDCSYTADKRYSLEYGMGIVTDPFFVEGVIQGMKELGLPGNRFFIREVNCPSDFEPRGYAAMANRVGAELRDMSAGTLPTKDVFWKNVPGGVWFTRIPYLAPVNTANSWLLNIAKLKADGMGLSLCAKNLQGTNTQGYTDHSRPYEESMLIDPDHKNPDAKMLIQNNYNRHVAAGIPRWDRPQRETKDGGLWQETWASRCIDNNSVTRAGLHIIEGIYGRDGNGALNGPNPPGNENSAAGEARDHMTNVIIFGLNPFHVDIVGHWMGGHEPGNFGLFHLAKERSLAKVINPERIAIYLWGPGKFGAKLVTPAELPRTSLRTYYLQRDYLGQTEPLYHLCNEPFVYPSEPIGVKEDSPQAFVLSQNRPNPFNPTTSIEFSIPKEGNVRLEVYNAAGQHVDVLADGRYAAGAHLTAWNTQGQASGVYFYRLRYGGFSETRKMTLVR